MDFDVADLLGNLFGSGPAVATVAALESAPPPEAAPLPDAADTAGDLLAATPFADWVRRPDYHGRMGWESPDLPEAVPFDALDLPGPGCPKCGSLEQWQDLLGRQRCGVCEADALGRALNLAERAARLAAPERIRGSSLPSQAYRVARRSLAPERQSFYFLTH
jgi:hypothetical protein